MLLRNGEQRLGLVLVSSILIILLLLGAVSSGSTRSEYDILLDSTGANAGGQGDGYGGTWYYYSGSDEYVMWFYNQPYDASRIAPLEVWVYIAAMDPDKACSVEVSYGWSTSDWSSLGKNHPPLPADTGHTTQSSYFQTIGVYYEDSMYLGSSSSIEPHETYQVSGNPEWICIIIRGKNIHVYRWIDHDCVTDTGSTEPDENDTGTELGAACNRQTGECYIAMSAVSPYVWLGAGTSCDDCKVDTSTMDFGDASASYPVLLSRNGARHTVKQGIYLGTGVSKESDGKPSATAAGDDYDDGVVLTSTLVPGSSATAQITASTNGVINAWIDWNRDGDWADASEKILVDEPVRTGVNTLSFSVPARATLRARTLPGSVSVRRPA